VEQVVMRFLVKIEKFQNDKKIIWIMTTVVHDEGNVCARFIVEGGMSYVSSLFDFDEYNPVDVNDCNIEPLDGKGRAVIDVVDVFTASMGLDSTLTDVSKFTKERIPAVSVKDNMTWTLAAVRGFGLYESMGFVSNYLMDNSTPEEVPGMYGSLKPSKSLHSCSKMATRALALHTCTAPDPLSVSSASQQQQQSKLSRQRHWCTGSTTPLFDQSMTRVFFLP
jgi:hypothetical protein